MSSNLLGHSDILDLTENGESESLDLQDNDERSKVSSQRHFDDGILDCTNKRDFDRSIEVPSNWKTTGVESSEIKLKWASTSNTSLYSEDDDDDETSLADVVPQPDHCSKGDASSKDLVRERPIFNLGLEKLPVSVLQSQPIAKSTRRHISSKLSKFVDFFERSALVRAKTIEDSADPCVTTITVQTARATLSYSYNLTSSMMVIPKSARAPKPVSQSDMVPKLPLKPMASVRDIIKKFNQSKNDGCDSGRALRQSAFISASEGESLTSVAPEKPSSMQTCLGSVKWQQEEKKIDGKVVGQIWRRIENAQSSPTEGDYENSVFSHSMPRSPMMIEAKISDTDRPLTTFDPIGEGDEDNLTERSSSYADSDDNGKNVQSQREQQLLPSATTSERGDCPKKWPIAQDGGSDDANKTRRASHFVAIRVDNLDVLRAVSRFQSELIHSAPFLDHCKSNVNKLHLTLLVLSLTPADIPKAKQAMQLGVQRFMRTKTSAVKVHKPTDSKSDTHVHDNPGSVLNDSKFSSVHVTRDGPSAMCERLPAPSSTREVTDCTGDKERAAFNLDFRTIGAFGTRVLFLSPPLQQRLLLQQFHVELARAFGEYGISIVGAGSGWNSAMEIQKQVLARNQANITTILPTTLQSHPLSGSAASPSASSMLLTTNTRALTPRTAILSSEPLLEVTKLASTNPIQHSLCPEVATPLDKMLLKQYDLSSARTTLYIPQITLFKVSKAAKRIKSRDITTSAPHVPKVKLFPRLYHNLVQRVLQKGLTASQSLPTKVRSEDQNIVAQTVCHQLSTLLCERHQKANGKIQQNSPVCVDAYRPPIAHTLHNCKNGEIIFDDHQNGDKRRSTGISSTVSTSQKEIDIGFTQLPYMFAIPHASPPHNSTFDTCDSTISTNGPFPGQTGIALQPPQYVISSLPALTYGNHSFQSCHPTASTFFPSYFPHSGTDINHKDSTSQDQMPQTMFLAGSTNVAVIQSPQSMTATTTIPRMPTLYRYSPEGPTLFPDRLYWQVMTPPNVLPTTTEAATDFHRPNGILSSHPRVNPQFNMTNYPFGYRPDLTVMYNSASQPTPEGRQQRRRSNERRTNSHNARRPKPEKVVTTSWTPQPPFGCQSCTFVELLEMSQMDPDGYYKRICRIMLNSKVDIIDNLVFQSTAKHE